MPTTPHRRDDFAPTEQPPVRPSAAGYAARRARVLPYYRRVQTLLPDAMKHSATGGWYEDVARAHAVMGDGKAARAALDRAQPDGAQWNYYNFLSGNLPTIAYAQARAGDVAGALETAGAVPDPSSRVSALRRIAASQREAGDRRGAWQTLDRAKRAAATLPVAWTGVRGDQFERIAEEQAASGDFTGAVGSAGLIPDTLDRSSLLLKIGEMQTKAGDVRGAARTRERTRQALALAHRDVVRGTRPISRSNPRNPYDRATDLSVVARMQVQVGDLPGARRAVAEAVQATRVLTDLEQRYEAFAEVARAQAKTGDRAGAAQSIERAIQAVASLAPPTEGDDPRPGAFQRVAQAQDETGDRAGAVRTLERAVRTALSYTPPAREWDPQTDPQTDTLVDLALEQVRVGDRAGARQTFAVVFRRRKERGIGFSRMPDLLTIAAAQAKAGEAEGAKETLSLAVQSADGLPDSPAADKTTALMKVASFQAETGDLAGARATFTRARTVANAIADAERKAEALLSIANRQVRAADQEGTRQTFADARQAAVELPDAKMPDAPPRVTFLTRVAAAQTRAGDAPGAKVTFQEAKTVAGAITDELTRFRALWVIVVAEAEVGDLTAAVATAESVPGAWGQVIGLCRIIAVVLKVSG